MPLRGLDASQIKEQGTGVFAREAKRRHIRVTGRQAFAQPFCKRIKLHPAIERAEWRRVNVRTLAALPDRMARRAHSLRQSLTVLLQRAGLAVLSQAARCCEQQKDDDELLYHLDACFIRAAASSEAVSSASARSRCSMRLISCSASTTWYPISAQTSALLRSNERSFSTFVRRSRIAFINIKIEGSAHRNLI